ncbi:erythroblast NAD(P)(+)--arginine ADP-ribosyltransferase-like [Poecilia formosa]|uniref:erythroblast NAD(P)(+)--arginine ADP-ribosyltransferase-like n=1 Tax=Poecilia formosa TaxID=48698 RepID=UPI0007B977D8|nr:PREDICTED: erythroblast NAD(P)(+)--arginine ADP-ribosyltransferase-like [Poecilia formosa]
MLIFISLCLLCWGQFNGVRSEIQLEMYENSIDDMFSNCTEEMAKMVFNKYFTELKKKEYWANEETKIKKDDHILTKEELDAIRVYTEHKNGVYRIFNSAVRDGKEKYDNSFEFHMLYFLLVSAVQKLKKADKKECHTTYRRYKSEVTFKLDKDKIRLGSFASSSLTPDQKDYGNKACLEITTCYGATIEEYSAYPAEKEVLIPPYELFELIKGKDVEELKDCESKFVLKSVGINSNLDCILVKNNLCSMLESTKVLVIHVV